jgi:poly-gamma-glutamate synthesis protein (capsule biosynthesis protein)
MHPNGLDHLVAIGFNLLSLANNHSMDYGQAGLRETLLHVARIKAKGIPLAVAGIGMNREFASQPDIVDIKGYKVAFAAIGIVTNNLARHRAGSSTPGQIAYRFDDDYALVRQRLVATPADLRILSIHYGIEGRVRTDAKQIAEWRGMAAQKDGIDLIVGHHAHVVRGVEINGYSLIFYGLGNFLHHGTANMTSRGICKNYGLFARVYFASNGAERPELKAVEVIPITDTHRKARRLTGARGIQHIHALNYLAKTLDNPASNAHGLRFSPQKDGSGLYCVPGAENIPGKIGALCQHYHVPPPIPSNIRRAIQASCRS